MIPCQCLSLCDENTAPWRATILFVQQVTYLNCLSRQGQQNINEANKTEPLTLLSQHTSETLKSFILQIQSERSSEGSPTQQTRQKILVIHVEFNFTVYKLWSLLVK